MNPSLIRIHTLVSREDSRFRRRSIKEKHRLLAGTLSKVDWWCAVRKWWAMPKPKRHWQQDNTNQSSQLHAPTLASSEPCTKFMLTPINLHWTNASHLLRSIRGALHADLNHVPIVLLLELANLHCALLNKLRHFYRKINWWIRCANANFKQVFIRLLLD